MVLKKVATLMFCLFATPSPSPGKPYTDWHFSCQLLKRLALSAGQASLNTDHHYHWQTYFVLPSVQLLTAETVLTGKRDTIDICTASRSRQQLCGREQVNTENRTSLTAKRSAQSLSSMNTENRTSLTAKGSAQSLSSMNTENKTSLTAKGSARCLSSMNTENRTSLTAKGTARYQSSMNTENRTSLTAKRSARCLSSLPACC